MNKLLIPILSIFISCNPNPVAKFDVVGLYGNISTIQIHEDSTYVHVFYEKGEKHKEFGKWKGSFKPDSTLITYIELENGSRLCSYHYKNINDTLKLTEWSIQ
jgi:hypothetical protein